MKWAIILFLLFSCSKNISNRPTLFVAIMPQKYLVEQIAGPRWDVKVLVGPNQNHETYEVTPEQLKELSRTPLYFRIGLPFENKFLEKAQSLFPNMQIIDTTTGVPTRKLVEEKHENAGTDPHIWLSLSGLRMQALNIYDGMSRIDMARSNLYKIGFLKIADELDSMAKELHKELDQFQGRTFLVYHPAFGYFADEFKLKQVSVEIEGKSPLPKELEEVTNLAKRLKIKTIFVQPQFATNQAEVVAQSIGGKLVPLDSNSEQPITNLANVAKKLIESFKE